MEEKATYDDYGKISSARVMYSTEPTPGVRYISGFTVYDEALIDGRLVDRYWSSDGFIKGEYELSRDQEKKVGPTQNFHSFDLEIDGQSLRGYWKWIGAREEPVAQPGSRHNVIELEHTIRPVTVRVHMLLDGTPVMSRWLEITNTSDRPAVLSAVSPWSGRLWKIENMSELLPPSQKEAFTLGWYKSDAHSNEGSFDWQPLGNFTTRIESSRGFSGFRTPFFILRNEATGEHVIAHLAWSGNWFCEFQCSQDPALYGVKGWPDSACLSFSAGPAGPHPLRIIAPGETVHTPVIHLGYLKGDLDGCVQAMHTHLRRSAIAKPPEDRGYLVQYDHGGMGMGYWVGERQDRPEESEAQLMKEADIAADLGCEVFILDSGWNSGRPRSDVLYDTSSVIGTAWLPDPILFPQGLKPLRDSVREKGMLFGLWVEPEAIGLDGELAAKHPDWLLHRDGKIVKGHIDLTNPEAAEWFEAEVCRIIEEYELDVFRLDYNPVDIAEGGHRLADGFVENTLWGYYEVFYGIFERVRSKYPSVILQHCAAGGGRNDLGMASRWHEEYLTDGHFMPRLLYSLNGMTMAFPPEVFVIASPVFYFYSSAARDLDAQLRTYMVMMRPLVGGVAPSLECLTPELRARYKHYIDLYKRFVRPLLPTCRVFHHSPVSEHEVSDDWIALEYAAPDASRSLAMIYKLRDAAEDTYRFVPRGTRLDQTYKVTFDNTGESVVLSGKELKETGLSVRLSAAHSSELLLFESQCCASECVLKV